jgi:hypothetical protein
MKVFIASLIVAFTFSAIASYSQISDSQLNELINKLRSGRKTETEIKAIVDGIIADPQLFQSYWKNFIDQATETDSTASDGGTRWDWLRDLNLQFKTFQTEDNPNASLGFSYDLNYDFAKFERSEKSRTASKFGFSATGNVAFKKEFNPVDFLDTKLNYAYARFVGGVVTKRDTAVFTELNRIEDLLVMEQDVQSKNAQVLWNEFGRFLELSNQYYYAIAPKVSLESNQDFSTRQFTPGLSIDLGAKAWNPKSRLAKFNILDYPFALLRYVLGTDKKFTVYGSTLPVVQFTFDYVLPASDSLRESFTGNLDAYPRLKFESGFRTFIVKVKNERIFFNANYRFYREPGASSAIQNAHLAKHSYLCLALQSSSGFYVSYVKGKLPFDAKSDQIYSIGFNLRLN